MTSIDFLNKVHRSLDSQEYNLSYSPAKSKNYMLYCNGNFIGGLFDEELCFVYADRVSELLGHPEPVCRGYSSTAQHQRLSSFSRPEPGRSRDPKRLGFGAPFQEGRPAGGF